MLGDTGQVEKDITGAGDDRLALSGKVSFSLGDVDDIVIGPAGGTIHQLIFCNKLLKTAAGHHGRIFGVLGALLIPCIPGFK